MRKIIFVCFTLLYIFIISASFAQDFEYTSLYSDHKARRVGDIVTIIVSESSKASNSDTTQSSKKSGSSGSLNDLFGLGKLPLKAGVDADSDYSGSGTTTRSGSMDARISVSIKEIMPNGNLSAIRKIHGMWLCACLMC